jgi:hypothetical protein
MTWDRWLYFLPKKVALQIFIALKNPPPQPSLNMRTVGPTASTITIIPRPNYKLLIMTILSSIRLSSTPKGIAIQDCFICYRSFQISSFFGTGALLIT